MGQKKEMKLPLIPIKQPKEWLYFNRVEERETTRDGENLRTGGWHCNTVKNELTMKQKRDSKYKRQNKYVKKRKAPYSSVNSEPAPLPGNDNG